MIDFRFIKKLTLITVFLYGIAGHSAMAAETLYCGDGILSAIEECDDGNFINRDGCSSYCELEDMTPPEVISVSIPDGQTDVSTLTSQMTVTFSEAVDPASINGNNIVFKQFNQLVETELDLAENQTDLTVRFLSDLKGEKDYSLIVEKIKDVNGNIKLDRFVTSFFTGTYIDIDPPNVVARPEGGLYHVGQSVSLTAYDGELTFSDEYIDEGAKIYYTLDGSTPTSHGKKYSSPLSIKTNSTLKYFGIDTKGNKSRVITQNYTFTCPEKPNAKKVSDYPECRVKECGYGFVLKSNVCVINLGSQDDSNYKANAATAPLFGSDTPMTISTKPALYITPEHNGVIPRPIHFVDRLGGTVIDLERDTLITNEDGTPFTGYLRPPNNLYSKSFPINFGYSFKSIFHLEADDGQELSFSPKISITVPFTDRYNEDSPITVFTFDPLTEEYFALSPEMISVNEAGDSVSIVSDTTGTFFIAQPGLNYNAIVFQDTASHWAKNYIEQLYRWGHVKGRSKGVFAPDEILTRAEFTKIALNAIGEEVDPFEDVSDSPFFDVPLYAWYAPYIKRAKALGLIHGYPDGSFKPDSPINRVEAIKILMQAFQFDLESVGQRTDNFNDVQTWEWYFPAANFAIQYKLIDGIRLPNGTIQYDSFGPGKYMKRGEMAKLAVKAIELKNGTEK
ncbi:S-layer homology domain-containing protein [Patescibacteria group bacterium]|nr:S-layer homology domain-containing protein [Patescibacteria group bacterium]MBU1015530.1 S-layer homology domain-containing protein [Patescibacteria group bacterium]MBU1685648.1 S-layer homology domain-containing protein [Patescibacteria group bacterium]MBU1938141.1 S-layer homology domain-containing protein [Patescibacteria group bacterium]